MRARRTRPLAVAATSGVAAVALCIGTPALGWADGGGNDEGDGGPLTVTTILSGMSLTHTFISTETMAPQTEQLTDPDDITRLGDDIFVGFQNGVGPQGGASGDGNTASTIVEMTTGGQWVAQWDVIGKADGVTADAALGAVIVTVNEDGNSSLYTITPGTGGGTVVPYDYSANPLPHNGGTDAISIYDGQILISASAPGTAMGSPPAPDQSYPAVYSVTLDPSMGEAIVTPLFFDEDPATVANVGPSEGQTVDLALTDPDSNEDVPADAPRFAGDFMLTSQGDQQQIFVHEHGTAPPSLSVLNLLQSVDDTAWPESDGTLFATDSTNDTVDAITGDFPDNRPVVAVTPCGANAAANLVTCPDPPQFPANYLGSLNPWTGEIDALTTTGVAFVPQGGLLFIPAQNAQGDQRG